MCFFSKADMGLARRREKSVFPISACKLTGGLHFSVQGVHGRTFLSIEFPVPSLFFDKKFAGTFFMVKGVPAKYVYRDSCPRFYFFTLKITKFLP